MSSGLDEAPGRPFVSALPVSGGWLPSPPWMPPQRSGPDSIRLLVVDENPLVRHALLRMAADATDLEAVGEAAGAEQALELAATTAPHVVTIGCAPLGPTVWQLARDLRDRHPDLGIVMLTPAGSDDLLFRALDSGASAFLSDLGSPHQVVSTIRHCAVVPSSFSASGLAQALRRRRQDAHGIALSGRELQVLGLLRDGRTVPQVAAELHVSLSTAKSYTARLYEKLGARNRSQALMTAVRLDLFDAS